VKSLLEQYDPRGAIVDFRLMAASTQANVFSVRLRNGQKPLVAKFFKPKIDVSIALNDEYESLVCMANAFSDAEVDGWRIRAPAPLHRSFDPPALLMTEVAGEPLEAVLPKLTPKERLLLARRVCGALVIYWSIEERLIADVRLANILADPGARQLAFVDPGLPDPAFSCNGVSEKFAPQSRDLAYLLFDVISTNVRIRLRARRRAQIRADFAVDVLNHYVAEHVTGGELAAFVSELDGCAALHIQRIPTRGILGPWRCFVRRQAQRRLASTLDELKRR
jgi:hypothetical protein